MEETVFEALAACYAAVLPEDRREGIAVVDIGAQSTELVVYYGDAMHLASTVRICGDHFTRDLAQAPVPQLRRCRAGEDGVRLRASPEHCPENMLVELPHAGRSRARAKRSAASSTRFWKRARRSCSASCAANWRAWAWSAR